MAQDPWAGSITGQRPADAALTMTAVLGPSQPTSGSRAFPVSADGRRWYAKAPNNPQGGQILATEYIVSRVGDLISAPVCTVRPMTIPAAFNGFQVVSGPMLHPGIASASLEIPDAVEMRPTLEHRDKDDNARRHAGVFALFDWCWGDDQQWLQVETDEHRLHSHDHGYYLPPGGESWTKDTLVANVDVPHPLGLPPDGLDVAELERLANALNTIHMVDLQPILRSVPAAWPVTDDDLEELGRYLERRAPQVASRIMDLRAKLGSV